jgi:hypothetical protein
MTENSVETVSFDFGGTLAYEEKEDHVVYNEILTELGFSVDLNQLKEALESSRSWTRHKKSKTGNVWSEAMWIEHVSHMLSLLALPSSHGLPLECANCGPTE